MPIYVCPISYDAPRVPVITNEGITYDFVNIARWLLRENTNNHPDFNPTLDPATHTDIDTLIYNRSTKELNDALIKEVLPLSQEEKTEMARLYAQLIYRYPALKICGIHTLEGMQALIDVAVGNADLYHAAYNGDLAMVTAILAAGADVNQATDDGVAPLLYAAQQGHLPVVEALLTEGADVNQARTDGTTPLLAAAQEGHLPVVKALLSARADSNQARHDGTTALLVAAQKEDLPVVDALLAYGADINQARTDGANPLLVAAQKGHLPVVNALLNVGADVNQASTYYGATPLILAAQHGHLPVVEALLNVGADVNQAMFDGATPFHTAILFGHFEVVKALLRHQQLIMAHFLVSIATQHDYPAFVQIFLFDATARNYYLNQIIINPDFMGDAFTQNPVFFTELAKHRNALWSRLRQPAEVNLSIDEHRVLLAAILNSRQEPNEALRHPLYSLFNTSQLPETRFFSSTAAIHNILDDIQAYMDTESPQFNP